MASARDCSCTALSSVGYVLKVCFWIGTWYMLSIFMTLFNKWLFAIHGFSYPLITTSVHFLMKSVLAQGAVLAYQLPSPPLRCWRGSTARGVALTGFATAADVAMSNQAFLFLSVTTYTVVKSSVPVWILGFSVCLGLRKLEIRLLVVLLAIVSGITIVATRPINRYFHDYAIVRYVDGGAESLRDEDEADDPGHTSEMMRYFGLALVLGASMTAGFRWACSQLLLTGRPKPSPADATTGEHSGRDGGRAAPSAVVVEKAPSSSADAATADRETLHPYTLVLGTSLCGNLILAPTALYLEMDGMEVYIEERAGDVGALLTAIGLCSLGGILAFLLLVAELRVVALTSGLSLSVAGTFKEVLTVIASVILLGEVPTVDKVLGMLLVLVGTAMYTRIVHTS